MAHNKKFSIYYYYYYHQLPSIIWYICGIGYLANALILEVSITSDSHYYKQYHNQDYSLCFNITTSFLLPPIAQHLEMYKKQYSHLFMWADINTLWETNQGVRLNGETRRSRPPRKEACSPALIRAM